MKVYISGPMTGYPDQNCPAFFAAEATLAGLGHDVANPARQPERATWADYLRADLANVLVADALAVLPGWEASRGAQLEVHVAHELGVPVIPLDQWRAAA